MSALDTYTESDISDWLGQREVDKARPYLDDVSSLERNGGLLLAKVRGTRPAPYRVVVQIRDDNWRGRYVLSQCTCPVGRNCKHAAAAMLAWLAQRQDPNRASPEVLAWIDAFRQSAAPGKARAKPSLHTLHYVLLYRSHLQQYVVTFYKVRNGQDGSIRAHEPWASLERALASPPSFVNEQDLEILRLLWTQRPRGWTATDAYPVAGRHATAVLEHLLNCGRAHAERMDNPALHLGSNRPGRLEWVSVDKGRVAPQLQFIPAAAILNSEPPWYLDKERQEAGPVSCDIPPAQLGQLLALPPLSPVETELVAGALAELAPTLPQPRTAGGPPLRLSGPPVPVLSLATLPVFGASYRDYPRGPLAAFDYATIAFRYGPLTVPAGDTALYHTLADGRSVRLQHDEKAESAALQRLSRLGFARVPPSKLHPQAMPLPPGMQGLASESAWPHFVADALPALQASGWEIDMPADFRHRALEIDDIILDVDEAADGWLDISPGIEVQGRPVALAPLLAELFALDTRWLSGGLEGIDDGEPVLLHHEELGRLRLPAGRLKPLVRALVDLFDQPSTTLRVSRLDAGRLAALELPGRGTALLEALAARLSKASGIVAVPTPTGFQAELRPYQLEGLAWLQHLLRHDLAGILADDMGLGKTAQTIAHLLTEKNAGRLAQPALVVLPTSLVFNWHTEAARFAPSLRVLALHGNRRQHRFDQLDEADIALTTYPLLWRDAEALQARQWSLLILDEAQTVKNAASKGAQVLRQLNARHRLALTGTPLENHLGELWAQFDLLLPGFLGDQKHFAKTWRTPIERHGDGVRRALLAARIKPFILRRRKEDVARELPDKTVIVRSIALEGGQRDLYETVRAAMDEKVRGEIAGKGYARSQIVILDALLKLRQVCCDPRLLQTPAAARVKEHAKLDMLMSLLPELIAEGRRILVFSQFTRMLALIAAELDKAKIGWVSLTGETRDRRVPVEDFQRGRAPVFLISLKAGGVGLNLTAADTVIHYDPWWNPAAENQATDRAHRIGQDKPVFVFKLVCAGSIEERIVALQERKSALAASVLSEDADALAKFGEADIAALLAPLPPDA